MNENQPQTSQTLKSQPESSLLNLYKQKLIQSHDSIDSDAIHIIKKLKDHRFQGYIVGGGVRDILVGLKPKDFDIATNASPQEVKRKISYSFIIGRRFKLVHTKRGDKIFEVATFRREATAEELKALDETLAHPSGPAKSASQMPTGEENFFGTLEEDSFRRDFTVNALFYDPIDQILVDHCNGLADISNRIIRIIGDPHSRLKEDPIRILRAIRLSQKLNFQIDPLLREAIVVNASELLRTALPRRREEWLKIFRLDHPELALNEMNDLGLFDAVMPLFKDFWSNQDRAETFNNYFRRISFAEINLQDPIELFAAVVYSLLLAMHGYGFRIEDIADTSEFTQLYRDELGIFKAEMISIILAIQMIQILSRQESYLKKGDRRKKSLLSNQNFQLGLKLGLLSAELTPQDYLFWMNERERLLT